LIFFAAIVIGLLLSGCSDERPKDYRLGILCGISGLIPTVDGFKARMTELGYLEGKNIVYDLQITDLDPVAENRILRKFVADRVDAMFVFPSEVALEAKAITQGTGIPVVFSHTNIEGIDLIKSVSEPGGNLTGVRYPGPDLALKRFEILNILVPQAKRIYVPYWTRSPIVPAQLAILRPAAAKMDITLVEMPADSARVLLADIEKRTLANEAGIDAILLISEPLAKTTAVFSKLCEFAGDRGLPIGGAMASTGGYSAVFGLTPDHKVMGRLAAQQVHKVLKGIPVGTIPVVSAEGYFLFNYKAAQQLDLNVPEWLLMRADKIIR
jgi:putative ABC transport system substrate-binding protein